VIHYIYTPQGTSDVRAPHLALRRQEGAAVTAEEPPQRTGVSRMQDRWPCSVVQEAAVGDGGAERWRCTSTLRTTPRRRSTADRGEASPALVYAGMPRSVARRDAPTKAAGTTEGVGYFEDSREEHTERPNSGGCKTRFRSSGGRPGNSAGTPCLVTCERKTHFRVRGLSLPDCVGPAPACTATSGCTWCPRGGRILVILRALSRQLSPLSAFNRDFQK
jgi:hypothetical protein